MINSNQNNIAGRLPENSRNSFIDLHSRKDTQTVKQIDQKIVFSLMAAMLVFDSNVYNLLLLLLVDFKETSIRTI